jgi:hypothetical protein
MPLILGTNSIKDTGYNVANSLRFDDGSSDTLSRSFGTPSSTTTWTISFWVKKCTNGSALNLCSQGVGTTNEDRIRFTVDNALEWSVYKSSYKGRLSTNRLFRDNSAWYNIVCVWDTTNGTAGDRMRIYVNGVEETSFSSDTNPNQNETSNFNTSATNYIGSVGSGEFFDGYMAEVVFIDGQALDQTSFGEFDEDSPTIWKPKDVSGLTFGTNGFYLDFENSGSLGADVSGNGNNFTVNNLTSIDQSTDTCTNNFATMNPLYKWDNVMVYSNGNLSLTGNGGSWSGSSSTLGISSGKWYYEAKFTSATYIDSWYIGFGGLDDFNLSAPYRNGIFFVNSAGGEIDVGDTGTVERTTNDYGTFANGDIMGVALDYDNETISIYKNGSIIVDNFNYGATTYSSTVKGGKTIAPCIAHYGDGALSFNFGSPPYAISSGNSDGNGYGNFEYAVPSGYYSLNVART